MTLNEITNEPARAALPELFRDEVLRIETRRLWLRWPAAADAPSLAEIAAVAACAHQGARWPLGWDGQVGSIGELVQRLRAANANGDGWFLGLADKARPGQLIGLAGIDLAAVGGPSLGFMLDVRRQGFGIMTEAARAAMTATWRYSHVEAVRGDGSMFGIGARRVLEKCGFRSIAVRDGAEAGCASFVASRADGLGWARRGETVSQPAGSAKLVA